MIANEKSEAEMLQVITSDLNTSSQDSSEESESVPLPAHLLHTGSSKLNLALKRTQAYYGPDLRALRLNRLKDYTQIFGLSPQNCVGLDSIVHGAEYRREQNIDEQITKNQRMLN